MRFFTSSLLAIATLAGSVFAAENPISKPDGSVPLVAGEAVIITWNPTTPGPITLKLRQGPSNDLKDVATVAAGKENSGSITYIIPKDTPSGTNYAFQISDDKTTDVNYTPLLTITSDVAPSSSSSSSTASGSTTSSSTVSSSTSSSSASGPTTTSKPETTSKHGHNNSTMLTSTTSASNGTISTTYGSSNGTTSRSAGGSNGPKATSSGSSGSSSTGSSSAPSTTAPSSGAVSLVMNSPLALVVCVLGAVMYLN